jgi:hypothetical protein
VYFDAGETAAIARWGMPRPVVIDPTVKDMGACVGANKQWPVERYLQVAAGLMDDGEFPVSLGPTRGGCDMLPRIVTATFRDAVNSGWRGLVPSAFGKGPPTFSV